MRRLKDPTVKLIEKTQKDLKLVEDNAKTIMTLPPDGASPVIRENPEGKLNVLAIVGPASAELKNRETISFEKAILAEIGLGRGRPYNEARGTESKDTGNFFHARAKNFHLTPEQYRIAAPTIFEFLEAQAEKRCSNWTSKGVFWLRTSRQYWSHRQKKMYYGENYQPWPNGARFSFSKKDELFLRDIYWAEIMLNKLLNRHLAGLAKFIDKRMKRYRGADGYKWFSPFNKLNGVKDSKNSASSLPSYLVRFALDTYLPKGKRNYFYNHLVQSLTAGNGIEPEELRLARQAEELQGIEKRLSGIQIRVTSGLQNKRGFIVVEIYPPSVIRALHEERSGPEIETEAHPDDDIPF